MIDAAFFPLKYDDKKNGRFGFRHSIRQTITAFLQNIYPGSISGYLFFYEYMIY